jgi:hypothetical protein
MNLSSRQRWIVLGGLLTATLAAAGWLSEDKDAPEVVAPAAKAPQADSRRVAAQQQSVQVNLDKLKSRSVGEAQRDPFSTPAPKPKKQPAKAPSPPPVVVAAPPPPPAPTAPPLPFVYMGKLQNGADTMVFLIQGERNLVVKEGEVIDSTYRVERVTSTEITLVYLPLEQRQVLALGEPK